jgi:hypothetical protein
MLQKTEKLLAELRANRWFSHCGEEFTLKEVQVQCLPDWSSAIVSSDSIEWLNERNEGSNAIRVATLSVHGREWYNKEYGKYLDSIYSLIKPIAAHASDEMKKALKAHKLKLTKQTRDMVRGDLGGLVIEAELGEAVSFPFFQILGSVYLAGHFPCGVKGKSIQKGKLLVY